MTYGAVLGRCDVEGEAGGHSKNRLPYRHMIMAQDSSWGFLASAWIDGVGTGVCWGGRWVAHERHDLECCGRDTARGGS
jgi:hypothetical protein